MKEPDPQIEVEEAKRLGNANGSAAGSPSIQRNYQIGYSFPRHKLKMKSDDSEKLPLVIVACGSFSPITYLHLRMFEMAMDYLKDQGKFQVLGGYFSPVSDAYGKPGLAKWSDRVQMCELAVEDNDWLMVDSWEASQVNYVRTATVLDHFEEEINKKNGGCLMKDGSRKRVSIMLLAGGDLIQSFAIPNLWAEKDLDHILGNFGCVIIERKGADVYEFLLQNDYLHRHRKSVYVVKQSIHNDISSTKIRLFIRRGLSIKYLVPDRVLSYLVEHQLYSA